MEYQDSESFYNSDAAAQMSREYANQTIPLSEQVAELLEIANSVENQAKATNAFLMRRRRLRLEVRLQRVLLKILLVLTPNDHEIGLQIYNRLNSSIDRLEKLC